VISDGNVVIMLRMAWSCPGRSGENNCFYIICRNQIRCRVGTIHGQFWKAFRLPLKRVSGTAGGGGKKGLAESLARPNIVAPARRPKNPRHIYQHLSSSRSLLPTRHPTTSTPTPPLSSQDISVATIRHDKGSDIPTNASVCGT